MIKLKNYKYILVDLDDTLLDFKQAESFAFKQLLTHFNLDQSNDYFKTYHQVNVKLWAEFEQGKVSKETLAIKRFEQTFKIINPRLNFTLMNQVFLSYLALANYPIEGSYELLKYLKQKYRIYVISNGIQDLQLLRLNTSRIMDLIDGFVFSEEAKSPKPELSYFDYFFKKYQLNFTTDEFLIIGDSISSDIQAAINLKIDSIWFNPKQLSSNLKPTYQVKKLAEIKELL